MDYWRKCIAESFEDAGIKAAAKQIDIVTSWVEGAHENYRTGSGQDSIPSPLCAEVAALKRELAKQLSLHEKQLSGIRRGVAQRRGVDTSCVDIDPDGRVTYRD